MSSASTETTILEAAEQAAPEADETMQEGWFADRRSGSLPPPRKSSVPPIGDDDVDPWLR